MLYSEDLYCCKEKNSFYAVRLNLMIVAKQEYETKIGKSSINVTAKKKDLDAFS
jgi:hypothetical protein